LISASSPLFCRKKSEGFTQRYPRQIRRFSALFPRVLHMVFITNSIRISWRIFLRLFDGNPKDLADAADEEKGEKQAVTRRVWKTRIRECLALGNDHKMLCVRGKCTQDVARGTVALQ